MEDRILKEESAMRTRGVGVFKTETSGFVPAHDQLLARLQSDFPTHFPARNK